MAGSKSSTPKITVMIPVKGLVATLAEGLKKFGAEEEEKKPKKKGKSGKAQK